MFSWFPSHGQCDRCANCVLYVYIRVTFCYRFGKPLVIDLMGSDVWNLVEAGFEEVQKGLLDSVLDKSILKEEK